MTKEQEITKNMRILKLTRAEAEQLYMDDHSEKPLPEIAAMEQKAKECGRRYEIDKTNKRQPRKPKPLDEEKMSIIQSIAGNLSRCVFDDDREIENITIINPQKEIAFFLSGKQYSISLTKHNNKK